MRSVDIKKGEFHVDIKGIRICIGDTICASEGGYTNPNSRLKYGVVTNLTPKGLKVKPEDSRWPHQIYAPHDTCFVIKGEFIIKDKDNG